MQRSLRSEILNGRSENELSKEERQILDRVRTVRLLSPDEKREVRSAKCALGPQATYFFSAHAILICPGLHKFPEENMAIVMAHEIGHALDPCRSSMERYAVSRAKIQEVRDPALRKSLQESDGIIVANYGAFPLGKARAHELKNQLLQAGIIELITPGIPPKKYPLNPLIACIRDQAKMQVAEGPDEVEASSNEKLAKDRCDRAARFLKPLTKPRQIHEVISDIFGARVGARILEERPPQTDAEKHNPIAMWSTLSCHVEDIFDRMQNSMGGRSHPLSAERVDKIVLADKDIQRG